MALNNLERFLDVTPSTASVISDLGKDEKLRNDFLRIISTSQYLADILVRHPTFFRFLFSPQGIDSPVYPESLIQEMARQISVYKDAAKKNDFVRRIYKREILRIGARDICGLDAIDATTLQISQLAEAILTIFLEITNAEFKESDRLSPLSCVALGKLGGRELNYSSDIDLLFLYSEKENGDPLEVSEHANRFVNQFIKHLTAESPEGHLYRIDLRLRPDGASGATVQSLDGAVGYYESRGELWERQMLIKARHVAGDESVSRVFLESVRPFIYPRTWLDNPIDEIPRMKIRIEATNPSELNIKLRRGGIRDIEFIVQALQLLNGGAHPEIQTGNTLKAVKALEQSGVLSKRESNLVTTAYKFFRLVEHRLQLLNNLQTHTLPTDAVDFRNLSKRCGYKNERKFRNELFASFDAIASLYDSVFRIDQPIERSDIEQLLNGSFSDERTRHILENYGFSRLDESYRNAHLLSKGVTRAGDLEFPSTVTKAFRGIAPALLEDIKLTADPDLTLKNLARLLPAIKSLEVFYRSLENEIFRKIILVLCSKATRFVDYLTADPLLLDLTLSPGNFFDDGFVTTRSLAPAVEKELTEIQLGLLFLLGEISISEMQRKWTEASERFFMEAFKEVFPKNSPVVVAGGKFGSREMSFLSDLDVFYVIHDKLISQKAAIERRIPDIQKKLLDLNGGPFLTLDSKLRPEGKSAPLLMTESEYRAYLGKRVSVWEIMAMTRFRTMTPFSGKDLISDRLKNFELRRRSIEEINEIYNKIIRTKTYFDEIDVKSGDGGIVAIEFIVQALTLNNLGVLTEKLPATIIELISELKRINAMKNEEADELSETYDFYRTIEFVIYSSLAKSNHKIPHDKNELASMALYLDFKDPEEFLDSLKSRMRKTAACVRRTISSLRESHPN